MYNMVIFYWYDSYDMRKVDFKNIVFFLFILLKGFWNEMLYSNIVLNLWMYYEFMRKVKRLIIFKFRKI